MLLNGQVKCDADVRIPMSQVLHNVFCVCVYVCGAIALDSDIDLWMCVCLSVEHLSAHPCELQIAWPNLLHLRPALISPVCGEWLRLGKIDK